LKIGPDPSAQCAAAAPRWPCIEAAQRSALPRVPFIVDGAVMGSVAREHTQALAPWPQWFGLTDGAVTLRAAHEARSAALAEANARLRDAGLITAWRDETYAVQRALGAAPVALIERAAARFWGTLTFGAHCNGYVADAAGRPTHLWIARRADHKPTDPGKLDNLVGGGVPHGQSPFDALVREGREEAGLDARTMQRARPARVIALRCDVAEGLMHEHIHAYDLLLADDVLPVNRDGEVQSIRRLPLSEAIDCAAGGEMTLDAALVTLDFALRHDCFDAVTATALAHRLQPLLRGSACLA
jgi:8-oxo-dGTP pyrophosphatase MutT (NUDIX family)